MRWLSAPAVVIQVLFAIALVQMIVFLPSLGRSMKDGNLAPDWLSSPAAAMLPSVWFLGLFEVLTGLGGRNAFPLAGWALAATSGSVIAAVALLRPQLSGVGRAGTRNSAAGHHVVRSLAPPCMEAVRFARWVDLEPSGRRSASSRSGRCPAAASTARCSRSILASGWPSSCRRFCRWHCSEEWRAFARPGVSILAAPLVLMFVALVGMRVAFAIPVDIKANWVIRLREPGEIVAAMDGSFTAMLAWAVSPFVLLGGISAGTLWGFGAGAKHAIVTALLGWLSRKCWSCACARSRSRARTAGAVGNQDALAPVFHGVHDIHVLDGRTRSRVASLDARVCVVHRSRQLRGGHRSRRASPMARRTARPPIRRRGTGRTLRGLPPPVRGLAAGQRRVRPDP